MKKTKLPPLAIAGIGAFLCLLAGGLIFGLMIKPTQDSIDEQTGKYNAAYSDSTQKAQNDAKKHLADNQVQVAQITSQWNQVSAELMPPYDISQNRMVAWRQLTRLLTYDLVPDVMRWVPTTGITPLFSSISIQGPPANPNDIPLAPLMIPLSPGGSTGGGGGGGGGYPGGGGGFSGYSAGSGGGGGGTFTVSGDFRQILYHFQKWNDFHRLVLLDGLSLHGNSPSMTATYSATVIVIPQGIDKPAKPLNGVTAGAGAAPTAGGGGGSYPGAGGSAYPGR